MALSETSAEIVEAAGGFDETGMTLGRRGLYVARAVLPDQIEPALEAAGQLPYFRAREEFHIKLLDRHETKEQTPISHLDVVTVKDDMEQVVPAFKTDFTAEVEGVGLIPKRDDEGSIVIVDFYTDTQDAILEDRDDILDFLEGYDPQGKYKWRDYYRPGMPVGFVWAHNTLQERRKTVAALENNLPRELSFSTAGFDL